MPQLVAASFVHDDPNAGAGSQKDGILVYLSESVDPLTLDANLFAVSGHEGELYSIEDIQLDPQSPAGAAIALWLWGDFGELGARHAVSVGLSEGLFSQSGLEFRSGHRAIQEEKAPFRLRAFRFEASPKDRDPKLCPGDGQKHLLLRSWWDGLLKSTSQEQLLQVDWARSENATKISSRGFVPQRDTRKKSWSHSQNWCIPWPFKTNPLAKNGAFELSFRTGALKDRHGRFSPSFTARFESFEINRLYWVEAPAKAGMKR